MASSAFPQRPIAAAATARPSLRIAATAWRVLGIVGAGLVLSGCASTLSKHPDAASLMEVDRAFARYSAQHGDAAAFGEFAAPDALLLPQGEAPVRGANHIVAAMTAGSPGTVSWQPIGADIAKSGDLGYTWGRYEFRSARTDGKAEVRTGKYVTIWKRQPDGGWKFAVDIGNPGAP